MLGKKEVRLRRAKKNRAKTRELQLPRLTVYRTPQHIYAQIISPNGTTMVCASTLNKEIRQICSYGGNVAAAKIVGKFIATRALSIGIEKVAFDRSGFKYHGRVKALADAAREQGMMF